MFPVFLFEKWTPKQWGDTCELTQKENFRKFCYLTPISHTRFYVMQTEQQERGGFFSRKKNESRSVDSRFRNGEPGNRARTKFSERLRADRFQVFDRAAPTKSFSFIPVCGLKVYLRSPQL